MSAIAGPTTTHTAAERPKDFVLDYAPVRERAGARWRRKLRDLGPWVIWPSWRSWICLALLLAAAVNLSWLPRRWKLVDEFAARDDEPSVLRDSGRVMYRAPDHSLWVRDPIRKKQTQLQPSPTHTETTAAAGESCIVRLSDDGDLVFWDPLSGAQLGRMAGAELTHNGVMPATVGVAPDGRRAAAHYQSGELVVWDVATMRTATRIAARSAGAGGAKWSRATPEFSADGRSVLLVTDQSIWLFDAETLQERRRVDTANLLKTSATWSQDRRRLIIAMADEPTGSHVEIIDPDDPARPIARIDQIGYHGGDVMTSADGTIVEIESARVYEVSTGKRLASIVDPYSVYAILPDNRTMIVENDYRVAPFAHLVDIRSGAVIGRVPSCYQQSFLPDRRTVVARDGDHRVRVRRLDLSPPPGTPTERSAWWSWRLWLMALPAALLTISLWRDARRRSRARPSRFDAVATGAMIAPGVLALTMGLAQTAVDRTFNVAAWWSGGIGGVVLIVVMMCGMDVLAGSRGMLWLTRAYHAVLAVIAAWMAAGPDSNAPLLMLDDLWTPSYGTFRATVACAAAAAVVLLIFLGRRRRTVGAA
jgi:WD40 repeat protein